MKIPTFIKVIAWCQVPARLLFTLCWYLRPDLVFTDASLDTASSKTGFYLAGARQLAVFLTLLLGLLSNHARTLAVAMFVGFAVELQDTVICYTFGRAPLLLAAGTISVALIQLGCVAVLFKGIRAEAKLASAP